MLAQFHFGGEQAVIILSLLVVLAFCSAAVTVFVCGIRHQYRRGRLWRATPEMMMLCVILAIAAVAMFYDIKSLFV